MDFWIETVATTIGRSVHYLMVFAALAWLEFLFQRKPPSLLAQLRGLAFWSLCIPVNAVVFVTFGMVWRSMGVPALFTLPLDAWLGSNLVLVFLALVIGAIIADFWFYWFHRIQHVAFWRFHAVHHSIEDMSAINSNHHISEELFRVLLLVLPASLVLDVNEPTAPLVLSLIVTSHGFWVHSNTRLHLAPLRWLFADNVFHRIHHSTDPAHFGKNFGAYTTLWDRLFGTAYFPMPGEWPATGLEGQPEAISAFEWIGRPFGYQALRGLRRAKFVDPTS